MDKTYKIFCLFCFLIVLGILFSGESMLEASLPSMLKVLGSIPSRAGEIDGLKEA